MSRQALQTVTDLRALEQFDTVPAGCTGMIVTSDRFAPHLRPGEIAVVDPNDKEPVTGELFVIGINNALGERQPRIVQTMVRMVTIVENDEGVDRLCCWDRFEFRRRGVISLSDGPIRTENWRDNRCVGRIIGFVAPEWERR